MSGTCEIGIQNSTVNPGQVDTGLSDGIAAYLPKTRDRVITAGPTQSFKQGLQAFLNSLPDLNTPVSACATASCTPEQEFQIASVTVSTDNDRVCQPGQEAASTKLDPAESQKFSRKAVGVRSGTVHQPPTNIDTGRPIRKRGAEVLDSHLPKLMGKDETSDQGLQTASYNSTMAVTIPEVTLVPTATRLVDPKAEIDDWHAVSLSQQSNVKTEPAVTPKFKSPLQASADALAQTNADRQSSFPNGDKEDDAGISSAELLSDDSTPERTHPVLAHDNAKDVAIRVKDESARRVHEAPSPHIADPSASPAIKPRSEATSIATSQFDRNTGAVPQIDVKKGERSASSRDAAIRFRASIDLGAATSPSRNSPATTLNSSAAIGEQTTTSPLVSSAFQPGGNAFVPGTEKHAISHEPFTLIDAGPGNVPSKWALASGHQAEAGFQDASLGWVSVRAQANTQGIHASVIPSSMVAAQLLSGHLPALNAHVANQIGHLNPITIEAPNAWANNHGRGGDLPGNGNDNGAGQRDRPPDESSQEEPLLCSSLGSGDKQITRLDSPEIPAGLTLREQHFSVRV